MENANLANGQKKKFIFMPHQIILPHKIKLKKKLLKKQFMIKLDLKSQNPKHSGQL